jgi:hypothetical protein
MTTRTAREPYCLVLNVSDIEAAPEMVRQSLLDVVDATLGPGAVTPGIDLESIHSGRVAISARIFLDERATMREQVILAIHDRFPGAGIVVAEG